MYTKELRIANTSEHDHMIFLEPWAIDVTLPPHTEFRVVGISEYQGEFEVEQEADTITIYGWSGCTIAIYEGDMLIFEIPIEVPGAPEEMSVRSFLGMVLDKAE